MKFIYSRFPLMTIRGFADTQSVFHGSLVYQHSRKYFRSGDYTNWEMPPFVMYGNTVLINPESYYEWLLDSGLLQKNPRVRAEEIK